MCAKDEGVLPNLPSTQTHILTSKCDLNTNFGLQRNLQAAWQRQIRIHPYPKWNFSVNRFSIKNSTHLSGRCSMARSASPTAVATETKLFSSSRQKICRRIRAYSMSRARFSGTLGSSWRVNIRASRSCRRRPSSCFMRPAHDVSPGKNTK